MYGILYCIMYDNMDVCVYIYIYYRDIDDI